MGVVCWEMLAGRRLFKADSEARMLFNVTACPVPSLTTTGAGVYAAMDRLCNKALARDVEKRFQTASDMAAGLEEALKSLPQSREPSIGSADAVAAYFHSRYGAELAARRKSVRQWLEQASPPPEARTPIPACSAYPTLTRSIVDLKTPQAESSPASVTPVVGPVVLRDVEGADTEDAETRLVRIGADNESTARKPFRLRPGVALEPTAAHSELACGSTSFARYGPRAYHCLHQWHANERWCRRTQASGRKLLATPVAAVFVGFALGLTLLGLLLRFSPTVVQAPPPPPRDVAGPQRIPRRTTPTPDSQVRHGTSTVRARHTLTHSPWPTEPAHGWALVFLFEQRLEPHGQVWGMGLCEGCDDAL